MAAEVGLKAQKLLAQGMELQPEEVNVRLGRVSGKKAQKMKGIRRFPYLAASPDEMHQRSERKG